MSKKLNLKKSRENESILKFIQTTIKNKNSITDILNDIVYKEVEEESVPQKTKKGKDKAAKEPLHNSGAKKSRAKSNQV
jgi:hypothetical protein